MSVPEGSQVDGFVCPDCGRSFDTAQGLGAHRARSHGYRRDDGIGAALPVDQGQGSFESTIVNAIEQNMFESYREATVTYLPFLARELRRRGEADLSVAFITLFLDVS